MELLTVYTREGNGQLNMVLIHTYICAFTLTMADCKVIRHGQADGRLFLTLQ